MFRLLLFCLLALVIFAALPGCSEKAAEPKDEPPVDIELSVTDLTVIQRSNNFGYELFSRVNADNLNENVFISPLSVSIALGMAYNGAVGDTRDSIQKVLDLEGLTIDEVNQSYRTLIDYLTTLDPKVMTEIANSNWYREGLSLKEQYAKLNRDYFDAEVNAVDFLDPATVDRINEWVYNKTHGKIEDIVSAPLDPLTVLILLNAVYFKGDWTYQFDPDETMDLPFYPAAGETVTVPTMSQKINVKYYGHERFQSVDLPYGSGKYAMTIFLPSPASSVNEFLGEFNRANFEEWLNHYQEDSVTLSMPRFELECEYSLSEILEAMGMEIAFTPMADFTNIFDDERSIMISDVRHKTYVKVDEEGTEAAAVTAIIFIDSVMDEIFMYINRPFVFVIRDTASNAILFMGKVIDPA